MPKRKPRKPKQKKIPKRFTIIGQGHTYAKSLGGIQKSKRTLAQIEYRKRQIYDSDDRLRYHEIRLRCLC